MEWIKSLCFIIAVVILVNVCYKAAVKAAGQSQLERERKEARLRVKPTGQSAEYDYKGGEPTGAKFELRVEDVFSITGRGTVVTGKTALGPIKKGDTVAIVREGNQVMETRIKAIEQFRKVLDYADPDTNVGLLLDGVKREEVQRDDLIVKY